ncbi:uroporphyrinogen-III synthase [Alcaligenes ammonioxydans]|uniref:uroporphyrinogen-III synthase n=1 Tax=Alcaligenes ammonioxydans TaxID=2582914 RepID=UPI00265B5ED5|nr:uroporphyrinogen-III synthase [Alcaligenes faecalis]
MNLPCALLTRPAGRNETLSAALAAQGFSSLVLPALSLEPQDLSETQWQDPKDFDLVLFVSSSAVKFYFAALQARGQNWPDKVLLAAVGFATAACLRAQPGVSPEAVLHPAGVDSLQDSEALWAVLEPRLAQLERVLIVRGHSGREWLGQQLENHGIQVQRLAIYQRSPAKWSMQQGRQIRDSLQAGRLAVLLSSSQSADAVFANVQSLGLTDVWSQCAYVVIHPRIEEHLQSLLLQAGITAPPMVKRCTPDDDDIVAAMMAVLSRD